MNKNPHAVALGRMGGRARKGKPGRNLTSEEARRIRAMRFNFKLTESEHIALIDRTAQPRDVANLRRLYLHCQSIGQLNAAQHAAEYIEKLELERAGESPDSSRP